MGLNRGLMTSNINNREENLTIVKRSFLSRLDVQADLFLSFMSDRRGR